MFYILLNNLGWNIKHWFH